MKRSIRAEAPIASPPLTQRFDRHLAGSNVLPRGSAVAVALSGGLDSMVLLSLLASLRDEWGWRLSAAHFDHRMRRESAVDAEWVRAHCEREGVPVRLGRARTQPRSEAEARDARYAFLAQAVDLLGADWLVTAHHADDQAETVMFRLLRGTGLEGLAGIPERRRPNIVRPLLPFWRAELEAYAREESVEHLRDPSNFSLSFARNRIRHQLIPGIEAMGAVDFRRRLTRLADRARGATEVMGRQVQKALKELILEASEGRVEVARGGLLTYDTNVRAQLLRALVARVGPRPGRVGTRVALEFITTGSSGRGIQLGGGIEIRREFDRLIVERAYPDRGGEDEECLLPDSRAGEGLAVIGGVRWSLGWERGAATTQVSDALVASFEPAQLDFPLTLRGWRPGDRIRTAAGSRKLKKVFGERRVGRGERHRYPLLADRSGVLWVAGLLRGVRAAHAGSEGALSVFLRRAG